MQTNLTLHLDEEVVEFIEAIAKERRQSVDQVVADFFSELLAMKQSEESTGA